MTDENSIALRLRNGYSVRQCRACKKFTTNSLYRVTRLGQPVEDHQRRLRHGLTKRQALITLFTR